ncbi:hypothetical protein VOLCADRAFT_100596 [Volvox carteri f. nagariensis]|uniref:Uncharacterized protein n=1 Tax=Volvox carteri f. nagariensis TaxID=3068 RepID=D8UKK7_VOLCA|nr:uncharacterized protein VOLCADRAFT_100596 [Volvox carteri f. nagariensis]EFJ39748.1 hypothetical protein VOLCADRAFT_100596 [Volvox carteri f. nagariensis]|eukprot:XP_002959186.1 hypothetical protein VOLCADRAFT_100596 [Volvox carteri f. nagariensis]
MAIRFIEELINLTQGIPEIHNWSLATFYSVLVAIMSLLAFLKPNIFGKKANSDGRTAALPIIATATGTSVSAVTKLFDSLRGNEHGVSPIADMCMEAEQALTQLDNNALHSTGQIATVRLEYPGDICINPKCAGHGRATLNKGGRDKTRVQVVDMRFRGGGGAAVTVASLHAAGAVGAGLHAPDAAGLLGLLPSPDAAAVSKGLGVVVGSTAVAELHARKGRGGGGAAVAVASLHAAGAVGAGLHAPDAAGCGGAVTGLLGLLPSPDAAAVSKGLGVVVGSAAVAELRARKGRGGGGAAVTVAALSGSGLWRLSTSAGLGPIVRLTQGCIRKGENLGQQLQLST